MSFKDEFLKTLEDLKNKKTIIHYEVDEDDPNIIRIYDIGDLTEALYSMFISNDRPFEIVSTMNEFNQFVDQLLKDNPEKFDIVSIVFNKFPNFKMIYTPHNELRQKVYKDEEMYREIFSDSNAKVVVLPLPHDKISHIPIEIDRVKKAFGGEYSDVAVATAILQVIKERLEKFQTRYAEIIAKIYSAFQKALDEEKKEKGAKDEKNI